MSNKNEHRSKKWLISRLKTSGSKRRYVVDGDYANERNSKKTKDWENLPGQEAMGKSYKFYNGKINYGLLVRFLRGKIGEDWDAVHSEIIKRIPSDLSEYRECVQWFVSDLVEECEEGLWDKREQKFVRTPEVDKNLVWSEYAYKEFYVHPQTNQLCKVEDSPSNRKTKGMNTDELRLFRESEKRSKLAARQVKKEQQAETQKLVTEILKDQSS